MQAISFKLSGKTACFKKPDVNVYAYFTYNNIHKPALLGLLGAIVGFGGYTQLFNKNKNLKLGDITYDDGYPEFYEKLKHLMVSIVPLSSNGYFSKKIQTFNNSVGYASQEAGGNLIVREQWIENPSWQIIILDDGSDEYKKIEKYLLENRAVYIPYLGKNDHPAQIDEIKKMDLEVAKSNYVDSLFIKNFDTLNSYTKDENEVPYLFQEVSPISLHKDYHFYEYAILVFTNQTIDALPHNTYTYGNKNYTFI